MDDVQAVSRNGEDVTIDGGAVEELSTALVGQVVTRESSDYEQARLVWNGMIDRTPALIARCMGTADVVAAVNFARAHDLLLAVRGGAHNAAGFGTCDGGMVIDLSPMRGVLVDPDEQSAWVQGGAKLIDVDRATQLFSLAVPVGVISDTGIAGLTLGGGMGHLRRKYGLTCDSLIGAEVVTADGEVVRCSEDENPELLWGLRGGGGNFGVVTGFNYRAYPVGPEVTLSFVFYPLEDAEGCLRSYREWTGEAPDEISTVVVTGVVPEAEPFSTEARGRAYLAILGMHSGAPEAGEREAQPLREFATPLVDMSGPAPYLAVQTLLDEDYPSHELRYYWKSTFVDSLGDELIGRIIEWSRTQPSPFSTVDIWQGGGQVARVPEDSGAFSGRDAPFLVNVEANWKAPADDDENVQWARGFYGDIEEFSTGTMYFNFPGRLEEGQDLLQSSFGDKYARLAKLKAQYDPKNMFRLNQNIAPQP